MISRWLCCLCLCWLAAVVSCAQVEIIDLDDSPAERYDLSWEMTIRSPAASPLVLEVDAAEGAGFRLHIDRRRAVWRPSAAVRPSQAPVEAALQLQADTRYAFTLKRRPDTVALLCNHRLVLTAPAPSGVRSSLAFTRLPAGVEIGEARYQEVGQVRFGDDFMRPEGQRAIPRGVAEWIEDSTWKVGFYQKDDPGAAPPSSPLGSMAVNPWQLSLYALDRYTANGFWFLYRGVGPSWVVANPALVYPTCDRYFVEAAVKPEYDSTVGLIAAYQDNRNYLLFRWRQREYVASNTPRAELVAVIDGVEKVLGASTRGFDPGQWYTVRINLGWQRAQALVDGEVLVEAANPGPVEGRIGLYADGDKAPRKPQLDTTTATMYVIVDPETGRVINDAADAMRANSVVYFDDVRMGDWVATSDLAAETAYRRERTGKWTTRQGTTQAAAPGRLISGTAQAAYTATTRVRIPANGTAGLYLHLNDENTGYLWVLSATGQRLHPLTRNTWGKDVAQASIGVRPGAWADLRVEADGPYVALYCNGRRVMDQYDPTRSAGRCGLFAGSAGAQFQPLRVAPIERKRWKIVVHEGFLNDDYLVTWACPEASWYPAFTPPAYVTPRGNPHESTPHGPRDAGRAAPLPTNTPGLYWNKGGFYHDVRLTVPVSPETLSDQILHLSSNYVADSGYRLTLSQRDGNGVATLRRRDTIVCAHPFTVTAKSRLVFARRGSYLLLFAQALDPEGAENEVVSEETVFAFRDPSPINAEMIGITVTSPALPAAAVTVESEQIQEAFEEAPTGWITQSGVWAVMARYSCDPKWNWFGGFGAGTPTVWNKYRLDGDQTVEVYMGIKMQYDNAAEEYARRYRDMNVTICADGTHLNTGYTLIRGSRTGDRVATLLLRNGVVVQSSAEDAHLIPSQVTGHRQWLAMRLEKRGGEIKVFLDNRLAMTYQDPDPLPGGYVGYWTLNNGIMLGRVNLSAAAVTPGAPAAQAPLVIQQQLDPLLVPQVTLNRTPLTIATFETGLDGWKERPGISGQLMRERNGDQTNGSTVLKVVNTYPAGDFAVSAPVGNLAETPILHVDYRFDPGAKVNLYVRVAGVWYEFLLTGEKTQSTHIHAAGKLTAVADGQWRHLQADLGGILAWAVQEHTGAALTNTTPQDIVFADWSAPEEMRQYGFGANPGGMTLRFDNYLFAPKLTGAATVSWSTGQAPFTSWKADVNAHLLAAPTTTATADSCTVEPQPGTRFLHLQGETKDGLWGGIVHVPLGYE